MLHKREKEVKKKACNVDRIYDAVIADLTKSAFLQAPG
jgi:hypothetical protein